MIYQCQNSTGHYFFECIRYHDFQCFLHIHHHSELIHVLEGSIILKIDGRPEKVNAGEYAVIFSHQLHEYSTSQHSLLDVCVFSDDHVPFFKSEMRGKLSKQSVFKCCDAVTDFANSVFFIDHQIPELYLRKAALYAILGEYRKQVSFQTYNKCDIEPFDKMIQYIEMHHTENITLKGVAIALGYEPHYLSRCFHSRIPINFSQYINYYRIDTANELLRNTKLSITEIAFQSGFQSIRTFNRVYHELTDNTPTEFSSCLIKNK